MALITTNVGTVPAEPTLPYGELAAFGRTWAGKHGFPPIPDEALVVEIGYAVAMLGEHQPDLVISTAERLGLPYKVTQTRRTKGGFTYLRRNVVVQPEPEPEPAPEATKPPREWGKARDVKLDLRLSEKEREEITEAATAAGMSRADYIRHTLTNAINSDRAWRGESVDREWLEWANGKVEAMKRRGPLIRRWV